MPNWLPLMPWIEGEEDQLRRESAWIHSPKFPKPALYLDNEVNAHQAAQ